MTSTPHVVDGMTDPDTSPDVVDAIVIGAGFGGLYATYALREQGLAVVCVEAGEDVGGTWFWNTYPGARCDVESLDYSFSFSEELQREWRWRERFATQAEILAYLRHVADRFALRDQIRFHTRVTAATFDAEENLWIVRLNDRGLLRSRFLISAAGNLSDPQIPNYPGIESFAGEVYHTGRWPEETVDFTGKSVGVIGTGSSAVQLIVELSQQARAVTVFQRTPNYVAPAGNGELDPVHVAAVIANYGELREKARRSPSGWVGGDPEHSILEVSDDERRRMFDRTWAKGGSAAFLTTFTDTIDGPEQCELTSEYVRMRIREIVFDPEVAERLTPRSHPFGAKRPCFADNYYETFNRDNVSLVDINLSPIAAFTPSGLVSGQQHLEFDCVVFSTGFDAFTGALMKLNLTGDKGVTLNEKWAHAPKAYLGVAVAGFPNLFIVTGPGSPSVLSNVVVSIEQHVNFIAAAIAHLRERGLQRIEPLPEAEDRWYNYVQKVGAKSILSLADSWYVGANIPGKPRVYLPFAGGVGRYRDLCDREVGDDYPGFALS